MSLIHRYQAFSPPISRLPTGESEEGSPRGGTLEGEGKGEGREREALPASSSLLLPRLGGSTSWSRCEDPAGPLGQSVCCARTSPPRAATPTPTTPTACAAGSAGRKKKILGLWRPLGHNFDQLINSTETGPGQLITGGGRVGRPGEPVDRGARREGGRRGKMEGTGREPVGQGGLAGRGL